jgi:hypothetical protein
LIGLVWLADTGSADPFEMDVVETDELRLLYFDPFQTYLVPHVVRNFHNSLAFQKRVFDWEPAEKSTVVLTDLSDYGNAGAGASPYNGVSVYIAPASRTLETMPSSERIFMIMNHELVHVANMDVANTGDLRWRRLFGGKPRQTDRHPESILYNYLTTPRLSAPRWYLEGAAVFMEASDAPRAPTTRWSSVRWCATTPIFTATWASCPRASVSISRRASMLTSTVLAS